MKCCSTPFVQENNIAGERGFAWHTIFAGMMSEIDIDLRFTQGLAHHVLRHILNRNPVQIGMGIKKRRIQVPLPYAGNRSQIGLAVSVSSPSRSAD